MQAGKEPVERETDIIIAIPSDPAHTIPFQTIQKGSYPENPFRRVQVAVAAGRPEIPSEPVPYSCLRYRPRGLLSVHTLSTSIPRCERPDLVHPILPSSNP